MQYTLHIPLGKTTSSANSETIVDRADITPIKWFTIIADNECYIGVNRDAVADATKSMHLKEGESYTTPEKVKIIKLTILRVGITNATVRGSAWA